MKIFDCFLFFNELELLELRLMTLYDIIDYFVLVEAGATHTGKIKEFHFENNKFMFEKYLNKIIYIKIDKLSSDNPYENEGNSRDEMVGGFHQADDDDYIIISDIDEIPNPKTLSEGISNNYDSFGMLQKLFYYYVNCLSSTDWFGPVVIKKKHIETPQKTRLKRCLQANFVNDGGWHYSFLGGLEKIKIKLDSFSEQQVNIIENNNSEHILKCFKTGEDLFHRTEDCHKKEFIMMEEITHKEVIEWLVKYPDFYKII